MADHAETREIVESGYDAVADEYAALEDEHAAWPRMEWLGRLLSLVPAGASVLDAGCGSGVPATRAIARRHRATGIDVSAAQIERARRNVPGARLIHADLMELQLEERFDAIAALYVVEDVPRELHAAAFERFHRWLNPSGYLLFTIEPDEESGIVGEWLGAPMFFSQFGAERTLSLVRDTGFEIIEERSEAQLEGEREVSYLWVLARRMSSSPIQRSG
ncbi:MAG: class I SAM-dependent methyltransferase [Solirubrobacterales bacterium]